MKFAISGGSGFVGRALTERLARRGDVVVLTRDPSRVRAGRGVAWNPPDAGAWRDEAASADVVINLAGENIAQRWTAKRRQRIVASRLGATRALVDAMQSRPDARRTFVSASAVGAYGLRGDETLTEESSRGEGFLADVVRQWEEAARAAEAVARVVIPRIGVVLDPHGGALKKMLPPFKLGLGGPIGGATQWMSWIDREDVINLIEWAIDNREARGVYNATAPNPVRNRDFTRALGRALHRPAFMPIPAFALRLVFGEMANETLLGGQRVVPARAVREGFTFRYPAIEQAFAHIF